MARLYRKHKRTAARIDVMPIMSMSANRHHSGGVVINAFSTWNPETKSIGDEPDHHLLMTELEACDLIAQLAKALKK